MGAGHRFAGPLAKRPGDVVKLRALWWDGPPPTAGDLLRTSTGRQYLIDLVGAATPRGSFTLRCVVVPGDLPCTFGHAIWRWTWTRKHTRRPAVGKRTGSPRQ